MPAVRSTDCTAADTACWYLNVTDQLRSEGWCLSVKRSMTGQSSVEGVLCRKVSTVQECEAVWSAGQIPLMVDTAGEILKKYRPKALVDAILAKRNLGTTRDMADLTIALGPGFVAGEDVDYVVETMRGHNLGRVISEGHAIPNTGVPGVIAGYGKERVIHAPAGGEIHCLSRIADIVEKDQVLAWIGDTPVRASLTGVLRGIIREGFTVPERNEDRGYRSHVKNRRRTVLPYPTKPAVLRKCQ